MSDIVYYPEFFDPESVQTIFNVTYQQRFYDALDYRHRFGCRPSARDKRSTGLLLLDVQNTFCLPNFDLFVAGRSGTGAVDDNRRLCEFIYRSLGDLSEIVVSMDTHYLIHIFHSIFFVDEKRQYPAPMSVITLKDFLSGRWMVNPAIVQWVPHHTIDSLHAHVHHYLSVLESQGQSLMIWPYHAMMGGVGHALVSAIEEAIFFHSVARSRPPVFIQKGQHPLTDQLSPLRPFVTEGVEGVPLGGVHQALVDRLASYDRVIIAGQSKSHGVAHTLSTLIEAFKHIDRRLIEHIYVLEDCMSSFVVPDGIDFTDDTEALFDTFTKHGVHLVQSTEDMADWE